VKKPDCHYVKEAVRTSDGRNPVIRLVSAEASVVDLDGHGRLVGSHPALRAKGVNGALAMVKKLLLAVVAAVVLTPTVVAAAPIPPPTPTVTFTLLTPLPSHLAVGETAVIGVRVESSEPFVMAVALSDAYYPGRSVRFDGSPAAHGASSADLFLTLVGTAPTDGLGPVQDWPFDEDWPAGVVPLAVRVGARFAGGGLAGATFPFAVTVT
jgi:hypothetical protein